jgi:hypothetical protein
MVIRTTAHSADSIIDRGALPQGLNVTRANMASPLAFIGNPGRSGNRVRRRRICPPETIRN